MEIETHYRAIDKQASKIFWKAPWWAKLPEEDKKEIIVAELKMEDFVDVNQAPPIRPGGKGNQISDIRGQKVKHRKYGWVALITGYAYARKTRLLATKINGVTLRENEQRWYAICGGSVGIIKYRNWKMAGNYEPVTPKEMMDSLRNSSLAK